jgi:hypothetical protein
MLSRIESVEIPDGVDSGAAGARRASGGPRFTIGQPPAMAYE